MIIIKCLLFSVFFIILYNCLSKIDIKECNYIGATGSSDNHALYLSNVIYSFSINNPNCLLYCYNLYLSNSMYKKIVTDILLANIYLRKRKYDGRVIFLNYTQNTYSNDFAIFSMSFKPSIIYNLLISKKKTVIWMDAGIEILKPLVNEAQAAKKHGFYMDKNIHLLLDWVHPSAIEYFNFTRNMFIGLADTEAGYLTVDYDKRFIEKVIKPWYDCSLHRECICPKNFTRKYYRRDQPALSMLIYSTYPYSKYVGKMQIRNSHLRQCDHRNGCNIILNYAKIVNGIK